MTGDLCELDALERALAGTVYSGHLHFMASTGSTNTDAMNAARSGAPHGSVFFADEQTAGRGRGDHSWHSLVGQGLYVSVLVRTQIPASRITLLPIVAGLAAAEAIHSASSLKVDLRWPNDLLIGPRKTGGILTESQVDSGVVTFAVVGIGINVHQRAFDPRLSTPGTSLDVESGRSTSRQPLLIALLGCLEKEIQGLVDPLAARKVPARLEQASSWIRGRRVAVHGPQACVGITEGLDDHGFLLVRTVDRVVQVQTGGIREASDILPTGYNLKDASSA